MSFELTEKETRAVSTAARRASRRFHGFVEADDAYQELCAWMVKRKNRVTQWREDSLGHRALTRSLKQEANRFGKTQKAQLLGFHPDDEYDYRPGEIELFLERLSQGVNGYASSGDDNRTTKGGSNIPNAIAAVANPRPTVIGPRGHNPSRGNNLLVALVDVQTAFDQLPIEMRSLLLEVCVLGQDMQKAAYRRGITVDACRKRKLRALQKMARILNGNY